MDSKIAIFSVLALAMAFAVAFPMGPATAEDAGAPEEGGEGHNDEKHEGKTCPFKDRQGAFVIPGFEL